MQNNLKKSSINFSEPTGYYKSIRPVSSSAPNAVHYPVSQKDYVDVFQEAVKNWRLETLYSSNPTAMMKSQYFKDIVDMGQPVVKLIVEEIENQPDLLFMALAVITKENPVQDKDRGNIMAMCNAWIEWYNQNK